MEQEAICRVCRCEGTVDQPLYHPCKCSGSIRYVHQDCLVEWLAHSRKKYCELCEYPYSFTPVYRVDMPDTIPVHLFALQLGKKVYKTVYVLLRACLVSCVWLFVLPYFTINVWRFYFWSGQVISTQYLRLQNYSGIHTLHTMIHTSQMDPASSAITTTMAAPVASAANTLEIVMETASTLQHHVVNASSPSSITQYVIFGYTITKADIKKLITDCIEGQAITLAVVFAFLLIFQLREWITQNIPEEMMEDEAEEQHQEGLEPIPEEVARHNELQQEALPDTLEERRHLGPETHHLQEALRGDPSVQGQEHPSHDTTDDDITIGQNTFHSIQATYPRRDLRTTSAPPRIASSHYLDTEEYEISSQQRASSTDPSMNRWYDDPSLLPIKLETDPPEHFMPSSSSSSSVWPQPGEEREQQQEQPHDHLHHAQDERHLRESHTQLHARSTHRMPLTPQPPPSPYEVPQVAQQPQAAQVPQVPLPQPPQPPQPQRQLRQPPPPPPAVAANNEDENVADDIMVLLDAIGMRGSLWSLIQNITLIALVITLCLGVAVWMPYLIGMTFVMADTFDVIRLPLLVIRMVTDPVIEWLIIFVIEVAWPAAVKHVDVIAYTVSNYYASIVPKVVQQSLATVGAAIMGVIQPSTSLSFVANGTIAGKDHLETLAADTSAFSLTSSFNTLLYWISQVEPTLKAMLVWYQNLAFRTSVMDRAICIVIGYVIALAMSSWSVSRALIRMMLGDRAQETMRQQYLIAKIGVFLLIELIFFPIMCGVLLDLSTMSLLDLSTSAWGHLEHMGSNPVSSLFIYWVMGTTFMLLFAWLITNCREILRPGVMWFIRDPNDPQFHPIRDIVARPALVQLEKLVASATMYAFIIIVGVGSIVQALHYVGKDLLPLQWNLAHPLSVMPFDLIIVQVAIPAVIRYFQPIRTVKMVWIQWMRYVCRQLRLTSFMFGIRTMDEEGVIRYTTWSSWIKSFFNQNEDGVFEWDGQLVRAPKHDSVQFTPGRRMLVPLDPSTLLPLNERERQLGHPASRGVGGEAANTVIVYTPPRFRQRVLLFMIILWISGSMVLCLVTVAPLVLGRYIFKQIIDIQSQVHDIYSYLAGSIVMLLSGSLVSRVAIAMNDVTSQATASARLKSFVKHVKDLSRLIIKWSFFMSVFGGVLPLMFGLLIEVYFVLPLRDLGDKWPVFDLLPIWIRGFACMNVMHGILHLVPNNPMQLNLVRSFRQGISEMDIRFLSIHVLFPVWTMCLTALLLPLLVAFINIQLLVPDVISVKIKVVQMIYPISLIGLASYHIGRLGARMCHRWVQSIREDHYLIGRRLHNLNEESTEVHVNEQQ